MIRFSCFILVSFCAAKLADNNDIEIQANVVIHPKFVEAMKDTRLKASQLLKPAHSLNGMIEQIESEAVEKVFLKAVAQNDRAEKYVTAVDKYEERIQKKGLQSLIVLGEYLQRKLNLKPEIVSPVVEKISLQYLSKLKSHFDYVRNAKRLDPGQDIDQDYFVIDMVNIANIPVSNVENTLLHAVLARSNGTSKEDKETFTDTIYVYNFNEIKQEMEYICKILKVCRPFPAFSDYFANILNEILKLYDVKFKYFIVKSAEVLKSKRSFLQTILRDDIIDWFGWSSMDEGLENTRESISVLRSAISRKHRMTDVFDKKLDNKIKCMRILMDIIDKAFDISGEIDIFEQFQSITSTIQEWAADMRADIESTIKRFINILAVTLKFDLSLIARDEIRTLADMIFYGEPFENEHIGKYLMIRGSKFVKAMDDQEEQRPVVSVMKK